MTRNPMLIKAMSVYNQEEELIYNLIFKNAFTPWNVSKKVNARRTYLIIVLLKTLLMTKVRLNFFQDSHKRKGITCTY